MITKLPALGLVLLLLLGVQHTALAQPTCTTHPNTNSGNAAVLFNVQNTNSFGVHVSGISTLIEFGTAGTYGFQVLYNTTPVNSSGATWTQGTVAAGQNGWVAGGSGTVTLAAHTTPQTVLSGLNIIIPASTTYGFALALTSSSSGFMQSYSALTGSAVNTFSSGGVNILTGGNISWGVGLLPATPGAYPRGFRGCINWSQAVACGTLSQATASGPASGACANSSFLLTATGASSGQGITYQWERYNTATSAWDPIASATNLSYTVTSGITASTQYRFLTNCSTGGQNVSNTVTVSANPFYECYCASVPANEFDAEISNVTFGSMNNSSDCNVAAPGPGSILKRYSNFRTLTPVPVLQGAVVPFSIAANTCHDPGFDSYIKIFIDFNADGDFSDVGETAFTSALFQHGPGVTVSGSITIPAGAATGVTGMRVVMMETGSAAAVQACASGGGYGYGETEDYLINVSVPAPCSGTPAVAAISGPSTVCSGTGFTLTAGGITQGTGITYQWQKYNTATSSWDPLVNATNPFYTVTGGITAATDFRFVTTCANGGAMTPSANFSVAMSSYLDCYCSSAANYDWDGEIYNVTVAGINNTSSCTSTGGTGSILNRYSNYSSSVPAAVMVQNGNYPVSVTVGSCNTTPADAWVKIWIDFDHDGSFISPGEQVYSGTTPSGLYTPAGEVASGVLAIPVTAMTGLTRMRVVLWQEMSGANVTPCQTGTPYEYGETEDYMVDIQPAQPCSGMPATATITAPASVCAGASFNLTASGYTQGLNIDYQWEAYNTATSTWDPIANATSTGYMVTGISTATNFRFVTECGNGGAQSVSATASVAITSFLECYCSSGAEFDLDEDILEVTFGTLFSSSTCTSLAPGAGSVQNLYSNYTTMPAAQVYQGQPVAFTVEIGTCNNDYDNWTKIFIDYNHDGDFDDLDEEAYSSPAAENGPHIETGTVLIPSTALTGNTRMRVVNVETSLDTDVEPCGMYGYGETEDYLVNIQPASSCGAPTALGVSNIGATTVNISWTGASGATGYEYAITNTVAPPSSGTPAGGTSVSGASYTPGFGSLYLHVRTNCGSGSYSYWNSVEFIPVNSAAGAFPLTVNAGCTGNPYTNAIGTHTAGEPYPNCNNTSQGAHTVWFRFVAPAGGAVRVSTDIAPQGTLEDTKIALYSATDPANYATFTVISCDEDGGTEGDGFTSVLFAAGLTAGQTYYIVVDGYSNLDIGTFCITVDEVTSTMIASVGGCQALQTPQHNNTGYTGWFPLLTDGTSAGEAKLVALVRNTNGAAGSNYSSSANPAAVTVSSGAVRQSATSMYYLDRNFKITNTVNTNNASVMFFMRNTEIASLSSAMGTSLTVGDLNVTKQTGNTCHEDFNAANGVESVLTQTASGSNGVVSWLTVQTNSFSNFYIMAGSTPLVAELGDIAATNVGTRNRVDWNTLSEQNGDYFEVERSTDAVGYTKIGTVSGRGAASSYSYWDNAPVTGSNYYRLKMMDASGRFSYSKAVMALVGENGAFTVEAYPNPVTEGLVTVKAYGSNGADAVITLMDITGKLISVSGMKGGMGTVDMNAMPNGVYILKYIDGLHTRTIKLNKQ